MNQNQSVVDTDYHDQHFDIVFVCVWGFVFGVVQLPFVSVVQGVPMTEIVLQSFVFGFLSAGGIEVIDYFE